MNELQLATDFLGLRALMSLVLIAASITAIWAWSKSNIRQIYRRGALYLGMGAVIHFCALYIEGFLFMLSSAITCWFIVAAVRNFRRSLHK